jgi:hypothetical protein
MNRRPVTRESDEMPVDKERLKSFDDGDQKVR